MQIKLVIIISVILLIAVALAPLDSIAIAQDETTPSQTSIVLGDISSNPVKKIKQAKPLADYLAAHLSEYGIEMGEVKIAPDMETMMDWIAAGEVDLFFDSMYPAMMMINETDAQPLLRRWKDGVDEYHTIFFVRKDSGLESLSDLLGQMIAFDEATSTSGYMLPLAYLIEEDISTVEVKAVTESVGADEVGYVFSGNDENTIQWVISGRVMAGVVDSETYMEIPEDAREHMTILAETRAVPRQVALARPEIDPELLEAITNLLLELDETEEGPAILEEFKTTQFDEFPEDFDATLEALQELFDLVQDKDE
jgi:phosphonate transport system substrate-binding protein